MKNFSKTLSTFLTFFLLIQLMAGIFLFVSTPQEAKANGVSWYDSNWLYRKPITVDNTGNSNNLDYYQQKINLTSSNFNYSKAQSNGNDLRFTDSDGTTPIDYWIESYSSSSQTATIWVEVPRISASSTKTIYMYYGNPIAAAYTESSFNYFRLKVDPTIHNDYGLAYPVTYEFSIPAGSSNLKAYKRYSATENWSLITEKTSNDFFNGIEAARFDYTNNKAYISVIFNADSDEIDINITDANDVSIDADYLGVPLYYDNRDAAVTVTFDDLQSSVSLYSSIWSTLREKHIWSSGAIIDSTTTPPDWANIQTEINAGYVTVSNHSRTHSVIPYSNYDDEIGNTKNEIIANLDLPFKKGTQEYLYDWIEPFGQNNATVSQKLGQYKYLADRGTPTEYQFSLWDSANNVYSRVGYSYRMDGGVLATANTAFDYALSHNGIHHLYGHPAVTIDWSVGSPMRQHIDYIADKKNIWYVPFGMMYLYHYVDERHIVTVDKLGSFESFDNFDRTSLGDKWVDNSYNVSGANFSVSVDGGLKLIGTAVANSYHAANVVTSHTFGTGTTGKKVIEFNWKPTASFYDDDLTDGMLNVSLCRSDPTYSTYYAAVKRPKVTLDLRSPAANKFTARDSYSESGPSPWNTIFDNSLGLTLSTTTYYNVKMVYDFNNSAPTMSVYLDDVLKGSGTIESTTLANLTHGLFKVDFHFHNYAIAATETFDNFKVRQYSSPEPSMTAGGEEAIPAIPTIILPTVLSSSAIRWNFTDNANNETGFRVYTNADAITTSSATANLTYLDETGLSENTQYTRYVKAYNSYGESVPSSATSTFTLIDVPTGFSFDAITTSSITVSASGILSNLASSTSGVYFNETSGNTGGSDSSWQQTTTYQDTGLAENTQYTYRVKARNGNSVETNYTATSSKYTLANTPTGFNFMRHPSSLDIYVDEFPNSNSGSSGYLFWRTDNSSYNSGWIQTREWRDPNMVEGQTYTYAVKYRNGNGVETATTTMGGVSFIHSSGGGGTPTIPQQTTSTSSVQATTTLSNTTSTIQATSTQATSTITFEKPISQMSKDEIRAKIAQITQMIAQLQLLLGKAQPSTIPNTFSFKDTLKQGITDIAVKYLQIILNQNPETQVAQTGVGSKGKETSYFGQKTKQAVIKFQEKYEDTILKPLGLTIGTGIIGKTTRTKLNQLLGK